MHLCVKFEVFNTNISGFIDENVTGMAAIKNISDIFPLLVCICTVLKYMCMYNFKFLTHVKGVTDTNITNKQIWL